MVSVIGNVVPVFATAVETITLFADQVKIRLTSQLIKGVSRVLQKLFKYFNGTMILTSCVKILTILTNFYYLQFDLLF